MSKLRVNEISSINEGSITIDTNLLIKGSLSTENTQNSPSCVVFLCSDKKIYQYNVSTNVKTDITSSFVGLPNNYGMNDITHSYHKFWILGINGAQPEILEFKILNWSPFTVFYNKKIVVPSGTLGFGLCARDNSLLFASLYNPDRIVLLDTSPSPVNGVTTAIVTNIFNLPRPIMGDLLYSSNTGKLLCTTYRNLFPNPNQVYITQYDFLNNYSNGNVNVRPEIDRLIPLYSPQGLFSTRNSIFIVNVEPPIGGSFGDSKLYRIGLNQPYNLTPLNTLLPSGTNAMVGASSDYYCNTCSLSTLPVIDPNQTALRMIGQSTGNTKSYIYEYGTEMESIKILPNTISYIDVLLNGIVNVDIGKTNLNGEGFSKLGKRFLVKNDKNNNVTINVFGSEISATTNNLIGNFNYGFEVDSTFEVYSELKFYVQNTNPEIIVNCDATINLISLV